MSEDTAFLRKPEWLKVQLPKTKEFKRVKTIIGKLNLHSVCQEARCPNMTECFHRGTATFLILGDVCTRTCRYCNVRTGKPGGVDEEEPERLVEAVKKIGLSYVVITSVTRDDLPDGGAGIFARCITLLKQQIPDGGIEVLIPDFGGNRHSLDLIIEAGPDVINHNMEVAKRLFYEARPQGNYDVSLEMIRHINESGTNITTKSGFMVGLGESTEDVTALLSDLVSVSCARVTIGQYQQPTREHWPVHKYYHPDEFAAFRKEALRMGLRSVESGPLVRSSYHAAQMS
jgi:lipoic acid synthetase